MRTTRCPAPWDLIRRLQAEGRKFACLSNSTSSPLQIMRRLQHMGVQVPADHIYTAAAAAADFVVETYAPRPRVYNLATEGIQEMLDGRVDWVQAEADPCQAIIIGAPANVYATEDRQRTSLALARKGAALVGISVDRVYPSPRGMEFGAGALTWMLAYASAGKPVFTGKPQEVFFRKLCQKVDAVPARCVLIGDNLESDNQGAKALGMHTVPHAHRRHPPRRLGGLARRTAAGSCREGTSQSCCKSYRDLLPSPAAPKKTLA